MQSAWKVLAPIDLGSDPEVAVAHATSFAGALQAELTLLHVAGDPATTPARELRWPANAARAAGDRLVLPGTAPETIAEFAEFSNSDIVLLLSRRLGKWPRCWHRSVTDEVLGNTNRAVCVTSPRSIRENGRFLCRRILCLVNLDGDDARTIGQAHDLAQISGAELILMGTVPVVNEGSLLEVDRRNRRPWSRHVALERVRALGAELRVPHQTLVMQGSRTSLLEAAARDYGADLVVVRRGGPGGPGYFDLDPGRIIRGLACPLLSVAGAGARIRGRAAGSSESLPVMRGALGYG